jgi:hypothetical protein
VPLDLHQQPTINSVNNDINNSNEYQSAIQAARAYLAHAQSSAHFSQKSLQCAQREYIRCANEVTKAEVFVKGVENRWGVIDVDELEDESVASVGGIRNVVSEDCSESNEVDDGIASTSSNNIHQQAMNQHARQFAIANAGEAMVNGTYHLCTSTTAYLSTQSPIYIHSNGPFLLHNQYHDVCIFQKHGYGDKFRWCIGLVPCALNNNDMDGSDEDGEDGECKEWNFALSYNYYWAEVPTSQSNKDITSLSSTIGNLHWGVCHGVRPVPMVQEVGEGVRTWWQFWK